MKIPSDPITWNAITIFLIVVGQILQVYYRKISAGEHIDTRDRVESVGKRVETVVAQTNGIVSKLQSTVAQQEADRVHTAEMTKKDKEIAIAKTHDREES